MTETLFWKIDRLVMQAVFLIGLLYIVWKTAANAANVRDLLRLGQEDRKARDMALIDLRETANALAVKTEKALAIQNAKVEKKLDDNTQLTIAAAAASANAAEVANSVNEKIERTNQRLLEQGKK